MISCVLLAAGLSERFGSPKALASLGAQTVIERLQTMLLTTEVVDIIIVLGAHAEKIKPFILKHKHIKVVYNKDYNFGQTSSFKEGLRNISPQSKGAFLLPVDYPLITGDIIDILVSVFLDKTPSVLIPTYQNRRGHPPIFHASLKEELLRLDHAKGINTVIHAHADKVLELPVTSNSVLQTFNTKEEFEALS